MEEATIVTKNLTKRYGDFTAVDNLTLEIGRGEVFGLLGPNGARKVDHHSDADGDDGSPAKAAYGCADSIRYVSQSR